MNFDFSEIKGSESPKNLNKIFLEEGLKELQSLLDSLTYSRIADLEFENYVLTIILKDAYGVFAIQDKENNFDLYQKKIEMLVKDLKSINTKSIRIVGPYEGKYRNLYFGTLDRVSHELMIDSDRYLLPLFEHSRLPYIPYSSNINLGKTSIKQALISYSTGHPISGKTVIIAKNGYINGSLPECENLVLHYPTLLPGFNYEKKFNSRELTGMIKTIERYLDDINFEHPVDLWIISPFFYISSKKTLLINNKGWSNIKDSYPIKNIFFVEGSAPTLDEITRYPGDDNEIFKNQNLTKISQLI